MLSLDEIKNFSGNKKILQSIDYTNNFMISMHPGELRSYATERNNKWKHDAKTFSKNNKAKTGTGKINNKFYRYKFKYDVVVPKNIYFIIMEYYYYSLENNIIEDVNFIEKYLDHIMMFCQAIFYYKDKYPSNIKSKRDMVPMYVKLIYAFIGREYKKILSFLEKIDVLKIDTMYVPKYLDYKTKTEKKGICRHYKFCNTPTNDSIIYQINNRVIITKAYDMDNKLDSDIEYVSKNSKVKNSTELNDYFSEHFKLSDECKNNREIDYDGFTYYYSRINENGKKFKYFNIGRDSWGNRLYHPFLSIKRSLREYTLIDDRSDTAVVDINNCHPYIFSLLFDTKFLSYVDDILTDDEIKLFTSMGSDQNFKEKIDLFCDIVASGTYYSFLKENIKTDWDLKKINMHYFYGNFNRRNLLYKFFNKNFNFINIAKYHVIRMSGYKRLCQILQRIEAKILIDDVFFGLIKDDYSVMPLHDAFLCLRDDEKEIKKRITNVFKKIGVSRLPKFDKNTKYKEVKEIIEDIKLRNGNIFLNKNILFEELNIILKYVGIKNRVFKEGMKSRAIDYIDKKFEEMKDSIDDDIIDTFYELRRKFDNKVYDSVDYTDLLREYKDSTIMKRKYYSRDVIDLVKVNPVEFFNLRFKTNLKTRLRESNYIY